MRAADEDLVRAAAGGDRQAFGALIDRHYDRLFRLAFRLTGARDHAEDLTHDICVALPVKLARFDGRSRFTTWLYRVAVNAAHDRRRRDAARGRAGDGWGDWEIDRRAAEEDTRASVDWLHAAMRGLSSDLRDTLALTMSEELTHAQAAEVLGISEGTVSWRLSEVRRHLKAAEKQERLA